MHAIFPEKRSPPFFVQNPLWPIRHGFFGLCGGISELQHALLQASYLKIDPDQHCKTNANKNDWCTLIKTIASTSLSALHFTGMAWLGNQKHTNRILVLPRDQAHIMQPADALITNDPHGIIGVITADCAPILMYDGVAKVVGAIHAGWRGAVSGVIEETIKHMCALGCTTSNLQATIGPMIRSESYQVSDDFLQTVQDFSAWNIAPMVHTVDNGVFFDLPLYIHKRLASLISNIDDVNIDTFSRTDFFSHRRAVHHQEQISACNVNGLHLLPENPYNGEKIGQNYTAQQTTIDMETRRISTSHGRNISWISLTAERPRLF